MREFMYAGRKRARAIDQGPVNVQLVAIKYTYKGRPSHVPLDIGGSFVGPIRRPMEEDGCKMAGEVRGAAVGRV